MEMSLVTSLPKHKSCDTNSCCNINNHQKFYSTFVCVIGNLLHKLTSCFTRRQLFINCHENERNLRVFVILTHAVSYTGEKAKFVFNQLKHSFKLDVKS